MRDEETTVLLAILLFRSELTTKNALAAAVLLSSADHGSHLEPEFETAERLGDLLFQTIPEEAFEPVLAVADVPTFLRLPDVPLPGEDGK